MSKWYSAFVDAIAITGADEDGAPGAGVSMRQKLLSTNALQVTMHETAVVGVPHGGGELDSVAQDLVERQWAFGEPRTERLPFHQLHGDVGVTVCVSELMNRADVGMIQRGRRPRFPHGRREC
jgi:hypothetical protein